MVVYISENYCGVYKEDCVVRIFFVGGDFHARICDRLCDAMNPITDSDHFTAIADMFPWIQG